MQVDDGVDADFTFIDSVRSGSALSVQRNHRPLRKPFSDHGQIPRVGFVWVTEARSVNKGNRVAVTGMVKPDGANDSCARFQTMTNSSSILTRGTFDELCG
jgi:hypothetical protein